MLRVGFTKEGRREREDGEVGEKVSEGGGKLLSR